MTEIVSVAVVLVLVASTRNCCLETTYSARVMATVSAEGGGAGAVTVSRAVLVTPPKVAETVAEVDAVTDTVVTLNVVLVLPAGTVTLPIAGTWATVGLLLERVTSAPPVGAAALKVTVPVEDAGPTTLVGLSASVESVTGGGGAGGETVSSAVLVTPPKEAAIVMVVDAVTEVVVTVKLAVVVPAATVTLAGTVATTVLLLERVTAVAAEGAGLMLTVPCEVLPPATVAGVSVTLLRAGGALGVQPDSVACVELPPPFTVTIQVGELKGCTWILKAPDASAVPRAVPSTKIEWLGRAPCPSRRSCPAFSSARVIVGGGADGATVNRAVWVTPPKEAEMLTEVDATTDKVDTVNVALLLPAGTVTPGGTEAAAVLLLERMTSALAAGAAAPKVTVPVEDAGPTTLVGFSVNEESDTAPGGWEMNSVLVTHWPPKQAERLAAVSWAGTVVVMV